MKWTYGLIETDGSIKLAELFFNRDNGLQEFIVLKKIDLRKKTDRKKMLDNLIEQLKLGMIYTEGDIHKDL